MLGFVEFLHFDWLKQIISWQMPSGCFGENDSNRMEHSRREQQNPRTAGNDGVDIGQPARFIDPAQPNEPVNPLTNVAPMPAGRNFRGKFVGLNSNARRIGYNDSKIRRGAAVMGMNPMDKGLGQLGKHHIKLNRHGGFLEQAPGEHNHEQGRVGDTRMRIEENIMGNQGFSKVGNIWKHLVQVTETGGGGDGGDNKPNIASDEDNFRMNRQINRKLLYEKPLNGKTLRKVILYRADDIQNLNVQYVCLGVAWLACFTLFCLIVYNWSFRYTCCG